MFCHLHEPSCVIILTDMYSNKLVIRFDRESELNVTSIHEHVGTLYDIGYSGLFSCDGYFAVYIQGLHNNIRMAPGKIMKKCQHFGDIESVQKFVNREGTLIREVGCFRKHGRETAQDVINKTKNTGDHINIHGDHNTVNNVTNIDNSVTNNIDNTVINLHIHAFGEEAVQHITLEQLKKLIGDKEKNIEATKKDLTKNHRYDQVVDDAWKTFRDKQKLKIDTEKTRKIEEEGSKTSKRAGESLPPVESDSSGDEEEDEPSFPGEPVRFEADSDSEYNKVLRVRVENRAMLHEAGNSRAYDLPHEMAQLFYSNPHNSNIVGSTKSGDVKYFDGTRWIQTTVNQLLEVIIDNWKLKTKETVELLEQDAGEDLTGSFEGDYSSKVIRMFDIEQLVTEPNRKWINRWVRKQSLGAIGKSCAELKHAEETTRKRIKRVSGKEAHLKGKPVVRNTTSWDEFVSMEIEEPGSAQGQEITMEGRCPMP